MGAPEFWGIHCCPSCWILSMGKPILPLLRAGSSFMLVPVGPGVYSERVDESRDLIPQRLGGDSCCPELPKAAGIFIMFSCLCCVAPGCCRAQHSRHSLYQMYWPLVQPAQPLAPILPLHSSGLWGFASLRKVCPWVYPHHRRGCEGQAPELCSGTLRDGWAAAVLA